MVCFFHKDTQAVGVCTKCGRGMCFDCAVVGYYRGLCPECGQEAIKQKIKKSGKRTIGAFIITALIMAALAAIDIFLLKKLDMKTDIIIAAGVTLAMTLIFIIAGIHPMERKMLKKMKLLVNGARMKSKKNNIPSNRVDVDNSNPKAEDKR